MTGSAFLALAMTETVATALRLVRFAEASLT